MIISDAIAALAIIISAWAAYSTHKQSRILERQLKRKEPTYLAFRDASSEGKDYSLVAIELHNHSEAVLVTNAVFLQGRQIRLNDVEGDLVLKEFGLWEAQGKNIKRFVNPSSPLAISVVLTRKASTRRVALRRPRIAINYYWSDEPWSERKIIVPLRDELLP